MKPLGRLLTWPIRLYQRWISRFTPAMCRFRPTCSQYALDAIRLHGIFKGSTLALWRILRCNPLCKGGWDPVPGSAEGGPGEGRSGDSGEN